MELRQLRHLVRVVELGSIEQAAVELGVPQADLRQEIAALEGEVSTPLLQELGGGTSPTEAGIRFFREAQVILRHAGQAMRVSQEASVAGVVRVGFPPAVAAVLGMPLLRAMRERYPGVQLQVVESLTGHLANLLTGQRLDLAVLYQSQPGRRWLVTPLVVERLFFIQSASSPVLERMPARFSFQDLQGVPLILPSTSYEMRNLLDAAFHRARLQPNIAGEIDSLALMMDAVEAGFGGTVQAWSATSRHPCASNRFRFAQIQEPEAQRACAICSLPNDELSPAAMAARVVLAVCARELVRSGDWQGAEAKLA